MGKWFSQILQGEHSLFRLSLPFRVRLFNVLALVGGMISLINGISSYVNNQDSVILGLNLGIAVLSFVLLFYAYKSGRYQFCYVVTIITIFLVMFPYLFFKSGGYKGGMVSFYIFGILFTVFMLEGKAMFFTAFTEMVVYIATILIAYQNPQMVVWFSSEKEVVMDLLIGFCASSISVAVVMYLHFRMYNKQQEILEEARIEAQSANKAKSAFLANMSHEIRTPINVMLGMNEMILRESESEEIRQYAKSIERSGGYLISLINNILDISRIESGKMEIEEGKYELRQLLDEVMLIAEKQAEQKSLKMNLTFDKTLPAYLIGDVIHIKQILLNLINNAVKYTKEGQIDIKVSKNEEETKLIFEVKDTGIGIKEENLPVLFDAFMRVDSKKNKKIKGTGLGLAIAKQLGLDGYQLVVFAKKHVEACMEHLKELEEAGITWHYVSGTIDNREDRKRLVEETLETFGRIDVLVNNAGVAPLVRADLLEMTEESYDRVMGINAKGTMFLTQLVANQMLKQEVTGRKRGTIVNVGSCSAEVSSISRGEYCISKSAIAMITKLFADRLAGEGILVHEVRPGVIMTDMTSTVKEKYDRLIAEGTFPIPRWGTPEDVAGAVSALCSDQFLYTTGNYIDIDGGFHIKRL